MMDSSRRYRSIALDAVGTLIFAEPSVSAAYAEIGRRFGSQQSAEQVKGRLADAMLRAGELSVVRFGEVDRTDEEHEYEFWRRVVFDVLPDLHEPEACFAELFEHFARPESWRCFEDVGPTLGELQRRGYRVLIASNFDARLNGVCEGLAELREVRCRVISSLVGYRKTHRGFYAAVANAAGCDPSEVLMVGDDFTNDVESARAAGLSAVHLRRGGESSLIGSQMLNGIPAAACDSGPKGRDSIAQGEATIGSAALGSDRMMNVSPEGAVLGEFRPFRAGNYQPLPPRAALPMVAGPGLSSHGPSGQSADGDPISPKRKSEAHGSIEVGSPNYAHASGLRLNEVASLTDLLEWLP
jgi:putative hydrolase of the HAD superfamily